MHYDTARTLCMEDLMVRGSQGHKEALVNEKYSYIVD